MTTVNLQCLDLMMLVIMQYARLYAALHHCHLRRISEGVLVVEDTLSHQRIKFSART